MPTRKNPFALPIPGEEELASIFESPDLTQPVQPPSTTVPGPIPARIAPPVGPTPGPDPPPDQPPAGPPTPTPPPNVPTAADQLPAFDINNPQAFLDALSNLARPEQHDVLQSTLLDVIGGPDQFMQVFGSQSPLEDLSNPLFGNAAINVFQSLGQLPRPGEPDRPFTPAQGSALKSLDRIRRFLAGVAEFPEGEGGESVADGVDAPPGTGGGGGGGGGAGGGGGGGVNLNDLVDLGQQFGGPGDAGVFQGPLQQVGQDPLSQAITGGLVSLLGAGGVPQSPLAQQTRQSTLTGLQRGGQLDPSVINQRLETAREALETFRSAELDRFGADLASRGLLGSGPEVQARQGLSERLGQQFAGAFRDVVTNEQQAANQRFVDLLGLGAAQTQGEANNFLDAVRAGTERQDILSRIALDTLAQNTGFNQALGQFGLQRDLALEGITSNRIAQILPVLNLFANLLSQSRAGFTLGTGE